MGSVEGGAEDLVEDLLDGILCRVEIEFRETDRVSVDGLQVSADSDKVAACVVESEAVDVLVELAEDAFRFDLGE